MTIRVGIAAVIILAIIASVVALERARLLMVPIIVGILMSYALDPLVNWLVVRRLPRWIAATCVFVLVLAVIGGFGYHLRDQAATLIARLPSAAQELREAVQRETGGAPGPIRQVQRAADQLNQLSDRNAEKRSGEPVRQVQIAPKPFDFSEYLWSTSSIFVALTADLVVVLFLSFYLLLAGDLFRRRFVEIAGPRLTHKKITLQILNEISAQISIYLFTRVLISAIVAIGTGTVLWMAGLGQPGVWGIVAGVLNVVPFLGPAVVAVTAGLAGFLQFHTFTMAVSIAGLTILIACVEAYLITPWLTSRAARMNPAAVFLGLMFWGWLWGVPGLLLAVPLLMILKAVSDHVEMLQPIAALLKA